MTLTVVSKVNFGAGLVHREPKRTFSLNSVRVNSQRAVSNFSQKFHNRRQHVIMNVSEREDVDGVWKRAEEKSMVNKFSVFVANSPLNSAKVWLAKQQAGDYDKEEIVDYIQETIDENDVVMFSFSTCPFCLKAKESLDVLDVKYTAIEVNEMDKFGLAIRAELGRATGRTSMPNIFVKGVSIGGCNDGSPGLMPLIESGQLATLLLDSKSRKKGGNPFSSLAALNPFQK